MTQGIDMSAAFVPATKCVALSKHDLPLKKMLYLYLRTAARQNAAVALLVVQVGMRSTCIARCRWQQGNGQLAGGWLVTSCLEVGPVCHSCPAVEWRAGRCCLAQPSCLVRICPTPSARGAAFAPPNAHASHRPCSTTVRTSTQRSAAWRCVACAACACQSSWRMW